MIPVVYLEGQMGYFSLELVVVVFIVSPSPLLRRGLKLPQVE